MSPIIDSYPLDVRSGVDKILAEPEQEGLVRLTKLVEHLFRVPVAHIALFGPDLAVASRIGSGAEHWGNLETYPLAKPYRWPDSSGAAVPGFVPGDLRFAASAPLLSIGSLDLGLLVIADVRPRPDFSDVDYDALSELARVFARKIELRTFACHAQEVELSLHEAERRFREIANSAPVLIVVSCADGAASFINRGWLEFTGRTLKDELGFGFAEMLHPDYREAVLKAYWDAFSARVPHTQEFPLRRHDGEYRWMLARGTPRFQDDGVYAGYMGCLADISDQRSALLALQKQALCTAAVAEVAGALYLILDPQGRIEQASPLSQRYSGCDPEPMRGRLLWESCDAFSGTAIFAAVTRAAAGHSTVQIRAGELLWNFTPVRLKDDELMAITATAIDPSPCCAIPAAPAANSVRIDRFWNSE